MAILIKKQYGYRKILLKFLKSILLLFKLVFYKIKKHTE